MVFFAMGEASSASEFVQYWRPAGVLNRIGAPPGTSLFSVASAIFIATKR